MINEFFIGCAFLITIFCIVVIIVFVAQGIFWLLANVKWSRIVVVTLSIIIFVIGTHYIGRTILKVISG